MPDGSTSIHVRDKYHEITPELITDSIRRAWEEYFHNHGENPPAMDPECWQSIFWYTFSDFPESTSGDPEGHEDTCWNILLHTHRALRLEREWEERISLEEDISKTLGGM